MACGWCDDGSGTGIGVCVEGGQRGPINPVTGIMQRSKCPKPNWFFTECPCECVLEEFPVYKSLNGEAQEARNLSAALTLKMLIRKYLLNSYFLNLNM